MDYSRMKVAELCELAKQRGVEVPKGAKKAEIISLLEDAASPIEVDAEVIENGLAVSSKTLEIDTNSLAAKVGEITEALDALAGVKEEMDATEEVIGGMSLEEVGICRKALSDAIKAADEKRLEFGRILRKPIDLVNSRCKELTKEAEELNGRYKAREKQAEEDRRLDKKNELREHYEAYAGILVGVVAYDKLHEDSWLNKGCNIQTAKDELEAKVDNFARDWKTLRGMNLEFVEEAEARLFGSLDLGEAIAWAGKLAEDKRKIEAMKAEIEPEPEIEAKPEPLEPEQVPADVYAPEIEYEAAPVTCEVDEYAQLHPVYAEPVPAQPVPVSQPMAANDKQAVISEIGKLLEAYDLPRLKNLRTALANAQGDAGQLAQRVMVIDGATQDQLDIIGKFCGLVGVTGTFKSGTLADVVQRENAKAASRQYGHGRVMQYGA